MPRAAKPSSHQVAGDHYLKLGKYQPWHVAAAWLSPEELRGYAKGTALAYLAREKESTEEDIDKALHTLQLYKEVRK